MLERGLDFSFDGVGVKDHSAIEYPIQGSGLGESAQDTFNNSADLPDGELPVADSNLLFNVRGCGP